MNPLQVLLSLGLAGGGALLGKGQHPTLDPEMLKRLFGPNATAEEVQALFNLLKNSPAFSQMLSANTMQGTNIANQAAARMGTAGTAGTPIGAFLGQAGRGYGQTLNRGSQAQLFMEALKAASAGIRQRESEFVGSQLKRQEEPTWGRMVGASMLTAGAGGFSKWLNAGGTPNAPVLPQEDPDRYKNWLPRID